MSEEAAAAGSLGVTDRVASMRLQDPDNIANAELPDDLAELAQQIVSEDPPTRFFGVQNLRRRLTDDCEASHAGIVNTKAYDVIVQCLSNDQLPDMQFECAWVLTNLLSHRQDDSPGLDPLAREGGGPCRPLVKLLVASPQDRIKEQACWALANIVGERAQWRDTALQHGLLQALTGLLDTKPKNAGILDAVSLLLVNLFRDKEPRVSFDVTKTLVPYMLQLLGHPHTALQPHIVWALSYMIEDSEQRVHLILQEDLLLRLRSYLTSGDSNLIIPTLRLFGNISSTMTLLPSCVLADGLLKKMRPLLDHLDQKIRRQVLFFVSNISDGADSNLQQIVDAGFLPRVGLTLLEADEQEKRDAFWIVPNFIITRGSKFKVMVINDCLEGFLEVLTLNDTELTHCVLLTVRELLLASLQHPEWAMDFAAIKKKIEHCGGLKKIELVQNLDDKDLARMSYEIIDHFFWHNGERYTVNDDNPASSDNNSLNDDNVQTSPEADKAQENKEE